MDSFENNEHTEEDLTSLFKNSVLDFIQSNGWLILLVCAIVCLLWKHIRAKFWLWEQSRSREKFFAAYHQDPKLVLERQEALEASRKRLQEQHDAQAELFLAKIKKREVGKCQDKVNEWEKLKVGAAYRSKLKLEEEPPPKRKTLPKSKIKNDYNPLMGSGGTSFRPSRSADCNSGG
uniref:Selenoprotein S n=1 Tax=Hemiscolopendra marginata TaxID=943146 RepID=A0A646QDD4_9MYRI